MKPLLYLLLSAQLACAADTLIGAGATLPAPLYQKWLTSFQEGHPGMPIRYDAVGSGEGVRRLQAGQVDFAASDIPLSDAGRTGFPFEVTSVPTVVGAVVAAYNLPAATNGMTSDLKLTSEALAGIFLGRITRWNDPAIKAANRPIKLPDQPIVVIHRSDRSGTTYAWTSYLASVSADWKSGVGFDGDVKWPAGSGVEGSDTMQAKIRDTPYSVGYVEFYYAVKNHISYATLQNSSGKFVPASMESIREASLNLAQPGAYPVPAETFLIIPKQIADPAKRTRLADLLSWVFGVGQNEAASLGFIALPEDKLVQARELVATYKIGTYK